MQKKSLDSNLNIEQFNKKLFAKSMELISNSKKIPINQMANQNVSNDTIKKYNRLDEKLQNMLKIMRNFTQAEKPVFNNPIDLASEILQQAKLKIQIAINKIAKQKNSIKRSDLNSIKNQIVRPQKLYPNIKPYANPSSHVHHSYLQSGRIPPLSAGTCPQVPTILSQTPFLYVDSMEKLQKCIAEIKAEMKNAPQLAIDVQHSSKSYEGFTCLIQISTRTKDYIIDVFPIWDHVHALQEFIGDPTVLKVMHGAEMDTLWLHRDFNIHIVNLFDTHKAARVLGKQKFSYAFLLNDYCRATTDKKYQIADWRQRPLSAEMLHYARVDTHYLLPIYDCIRVQLRNLTSSMHLSLSSCLQDIHRSSHAVTLCPLTLFSIQTKQPYSSLFLEFTQKSKQFQFKAIHEIFSQIDRVAKRTDENFDDILPRRDLMDAVGILKDLVWNRRPGLSKQNRIQRIADILGKNSELSTQSIKSIKNVLYTIFCNQAQSTVKLNNSLPQIKNEPMHQEQPKEGVNKPIKINQGIEQFRRQSAKGQKRVLVQQFGAKNYKLESGLFFNRLSKVNNKNKDHNRDWMNRIKFENIQQFLCKKYNIQAQEAQVEAESQQMMQQNQQISEQQDLKQQQEQQQQKGVIQFTRVKPDTIYTLEATDKDKDDEAIANSRKPKKMRKQAEYERRIKSKMGNVYQLLGDQ